jgi:hypothetical protein
VLNDALVRRASQRTVPAAVDVAEEKSADGVHAFQAEAPASADPEGNQGGDAGSDIDMK